ncbi:PqiC family protein [Neptuniibacter marinus]|uniref:PqiC family protein n=1 Tax=Neptuniibacter marinus TaxID=1806670 RepID=UPI003B5955BE
MPTTKGLMALAISFLLLSGCAQQTSRDENQFYLLSSDSAAIQKVDTKHVIGLKPVTVAAYLNNAGIAIQTTESQLKIANHHLWAEQPNLAITRVLHGELNKKLSHSRIDNGQFGRSSDWQYSLSTHVDQFHGTENGLATFSGYWQLDKQGKVLFSARFNLSAPLEEPGYAALVSQLRQLLSQLAEDQTQQITNQLNE